MTVAIEGAVRDERWVPSGKRSWHEEDTILFYAERIVDAMRVALDPKFPNVRHGESMDRRPFCVVPLILWTELKPVLSPLTRIVRLRLEEETRYYEKEGNVLLRFKRCR